MANVKKTVKIDLVANGNRKSDYFGKVYGRIHFEEPLNLRGLVEHILTHGTPYTRDIVQGVTIRLRDCIVELLSEGTGVKIDGLGTFRPTLQNTKGGADSAQDWNVQEHTEGVHIRFIPEGQKLDRITSRAMLDKCVLEKAYEVTYKEVTVGGKPKKVPVYTPVVTPDEQPEP